MSKYDDIWPFNDRRLAIQTTVFLAWIFAFSSRLKIQLFVFGNVDAIEYDRHIAR